MNTTTKRSLTDLPEVTMREVIHRLRFWVAMKNIPGVDQMRVKITLPTREAQCMAYKALLTEMGGLGSQEAQPQQCPNGAFILKLEGIEVMIASETYPWINK